MYTGRSIGRGSSASREDSGVEEEIGVLLQEIGGEDAGCAATDDHDLLLVEYGHGGSPPLLIADQCTLGV